MKKEYIKIRFSVAVSIQVEYNHRLKAEEVSKQPMETQSRLPTIGFRAENREGIE